MYLQTIAIFLSGFLGLSILPANPASEVSDSFQTEALSAAGLSATLPLTGQSFGELLTLDSDPVSTPLNLKDRLLPSMARIVSGQMSQTELENQGFVVFRYSHSDRDKPQNLSDSELKSFVKRLGLQDTPEQLDQVAALDRSRVELAKNIIDHGNEGILLLGQVDGVLYLLTYDNGEGIKDLEGVMTGALPSHGGRFSGGNRALRLHRNGVLGMNGIFSIESHHRGLQYRSPTPSVYESAVGEGLLVSMVVPAISPAMLPVQSAIVPIRQQS